jgi:acetyltransferase-like isoleucine patch superfamily enzyme
MVFFNEDRNKNLRAQILQYHISSVMTDDERAQLFGLPQGCRMRENAKIISPENFTWGEYVWIGEGAVLDASGGLTIGSHTSIGLYVLVWTHTSYLANLAMNNVIKSPLIERKPTKIGSGCFIAGHSVIYPGVTIGDRVVVSPMSVITQDIPGNCIVAGSPGKIIKKIDDEFIQSEIERVLASQGSSETSS